MTGLFDKIVLTFLSSLSVVDYIVIVFLILVLGLFISSWYERANKITTTLKEIRDSLDKSLLNK